MGVGFSHGGASWSYSGFHRFRTLIAEKAGIDLNFMEGFGGVIKWETIQDDIEYLLKHSDCDGVLTVEECIKIIPRLELVIPLIDESFENRYDKSNGILLLNGLKEAVNKNEEFKFC